MSIPLPLPARLSRLPRTAAGLPIPWFVAWKDGRYDFRVVDARKLQPAIRQRLCWLCGHQLGRMMCFVVGPMCVVNRVSSEPPMHRDCAEYALRACPFLTQPSRERREGGGLMPVEPHMAGTPILRNPGAAALYVTRDYTVKQVPGGILFDMGEPQEVTWWALGRAATRAEVVTSIEGGLPTLVEMAEQEGDRAVAALAEQVRAALKLLPPGDVA
jgi:hypothetical protein